MLRALLRAPSPRLAELALPGAPPIEFALACAQQQALAQRLAALGFALEWLPPLEPSARGCAVGDLGLALADVGVLARPAEAARRAEPEAAADWLARGRALVRLSAPAELEGADLWADDDTLYVGQSSRTNHAGLKQLAQQMLAHGYRLKAVEVRGCAQLANAFTALPGERALVQRAHLNLARMHELELLEAHPDEPAGAAGLALGALLLLPESAPRSAERAAAAGVQVELVALSEFEKAGIALRSLVLFDLLA